jgi:sigma-B regulation protein RsbU (phosphoserine phosphatase)
MTTGLANQQGAPRLSILARLRARLHLRITSFRAKFILVVGAAVLFDLLLSGGVALWNVHRLSRNATQEIDVGLTEASREYLQNYLKTTSDRANIFLKEVEAEVDVLASALQSLIDHPALSNAIGQAIAADPSLSTALAYHPGRNWSENAPGEPSAVTVWGYLLTAMHQPTPAAAAAVTRSDILDLIGPGIEKAGARKLQIYYMGPKDAPILRSVPYTDQGVTFDRVYPGHNTHNWWSFFFPGLYESWESWIKNPALRPVPSDTTVLSPYVDGVTGKIIVSFFHTLWTRNRQGVAGAVGADLTLDQLGDIVRGIRIDQSGFAFLALSGGSVLAASPAAERTLGIADEKGGAADRNLRHSSEPAIADLGLPHGKVIATHYVTLEEGGKPVRYVILLKQLRPLNMWTGQGAVKKDAMVIGFVVPEPEIYATLIATRHTIARAARNITLFQIASLIFSLTVVLIAVFAISKRITAGLSELARAARRLQMKDYSVRVAIPEQDEVGQLGIAFNRMAEEIRYHTENLEQLVAARTAELATANQQITSLNERLRGENLRLGAELDVAQRIQMMILPKPGELVAIPHLEIATLMHPAEEVGGDYYDVLTVGQRVKIGIGDVTGHGLESGVLMLMVQSVARALQEQGEADPCRFLDVLNRAIYKNVQRTDLDKSLTLAFVDYVGDQVTLTGQHEEVLIIHPDGEMECIDTEGLGFPIGLEEEIAPFIATVNLRFASGDIMILHTDGVTEAENAAGELYGFDRLKESAMRHRAGDAEQILRGLVADLMAHIGSQRIFDDITLVILKHR